MKSTKQTYNWLKSFTDLLRVYFDVPVVRAHVVPGADLGDGVLGKYDPKEKEVSLCYEFLLSAPKWRVAKTLVYEFCHAWAWGHYEELSLLYNVYGYNDLVYPTKACLNEEVARQMAGGKDIRAVYGVLDSEEAFMGSLRKGRCNNDMILKVMELAMGRPGISIPRVIWDEIKIPGYDE